MDDAARRRFIREHTTLEPAPFVPEVRLHMGGEAMPLVGGGRAGRRSACRSHRRTGPGRGPAARPWPATCSTTPSWCAASASPTSARAAAWSRSRRRWPGRRGAAIDIEPYAIEAARAQRRGQRRDARAAGERTRSGRDDGWDVVLAGDVWYEAELADRMGPWLRALAGRGALVLTGDLGRAYLPESGLEELARAEVPTLVDLEDVPSKVGARPPPG